MREPFGSVLERAGLSGQQQVIYRDLLRELGHGLERLTADSGKGEEAEFSVTTSDPELEEVLMRSVLQAARFVKRPDVAESAGRAALLLISASFETLVARVSALLIMTKPEVVSLGSKKLELAVFEQLSSPEAAKTYVASQVVEGLMHGGIDDWAKWFLQFGVNWRDIPESWWAFREVDARRNLVAHTDGRVNSIYTGLAKSNSAPSVPADGERLLIDRPYLNRARDELVSFGLLMCASSALTLVPGELDATYSWGSRQARELLEEGATGAARRVSRKLLDVARGRLDRPQQVDLQVTEWLARKSEEGLDAIRGEVENFDVRGLDLALSHYRDLILENDDETILAVNTLIARGDLTRTGVRLAIEYRELLERVGVERIGVNTTSGFE